MISAYSGSTIRAIEEPVVSAPDYDGYLMQRAALALSSSLENYLGTKNKVLLLVGKGNNGADALFAGASLAQGGTAVDALLTEGSAVEHALGAFLEAGGEALAELPESLDDYAVVVDAILGTGSRGGLRNTSQQVVQSLREIQLRGELPTVVACDLPSGIDADSGEVFEPVLRAQRTVTFIAAKTPFLTSAETLCGEIVVADLGISDLLRETTADVVRYSDAELAGCLPQPGAFDHKYTRGVLGMICGSEEYPGAALMSTQAAVNTGPGMVRFLGTDRLNYQIQLNTPEAVCSQQKPEELHVQAWAAGSGANPEYRQQDLLHAIQAKEAAVLDAAAVEVAGRWVAMEAILGSHKILTPHAGELEGFLQWIQVLDAQRWKEKVGEEKAPSRADIEAHPVFWARRAAVLSGATVLLKGATTLIASPSGKVISVAPGTPWLATAGSGDTLCGILGALLAQYEASLEQENSTMPASGEEKPEPENYARIAACAVRIHHLATDVVHQGGLQGPVPPSQVVRHIPQAVATFLAS